ncbi:DUF4388 domain-containing protein [Chloracidobacterium validum]|uniref:DUF4388 domain-containing protein n=1 Tax=Chloracidobacterium validum TaxID=2821543 RepID=A0ABX8B9R1_9BACT|nr:DUF4388 domain-containing protein [Chloracidobacterium validum]QUW03671.1 DUF4388 domain-containing protein [Chloracidobacterium validum]
MTSPLLQGDLVQDGLPDVIRRIYTRRLSGELVVRQQAISKAIYFELGAIVFARSNDRADRIGESMMRNGLLSQADFLRASEAMGRGKRFGRVLVELGIVSERDLSNAVTFQILGIIYSLFEWTSGEYQFTKQEKLVPDDLRLELSTANIVLEGVRRIRDFSIIQRGMGDLNRLIGPSSNPLLRTQSLSLKPIERQLIAGINIPMNVLQAMMLVNGPPNATLQALYGLISAGILERQAAPVVNRETGQMEIPAEVVEQAVSAPPVIPPKVADAAAKRTGSLKAVNMLLAMQARLDTTNDPHEILGVSPHATRDEIRDAYYRLAKDFHPDRHLNATLETRRQVDAVFARVTEAYEAIRDGGQKPTVLSPMPLTAVTPSPRGSAPLPPPTSPALAGETTAQREARAEKAFQDARAKIANRDFVGAVTLLREAVTLNPDAARYHLLLGTTLAAHPKMQRDAENALKKAAELDQFNTAPLVALGQLYARAGMNIQAEKMFNEALRLDPDSKVARKGLEAIKSTKGGGFFDKLFKK